MVVVLVVLVGVAEAGPRPHVTRAPCGVSGLVPGGGYGGGYRGNCGGGAIFAPIPFFPPVRFCPPPVVYAPPVYYTPPPVYYTPPPVVYSPPPVYVQQAPSVVVTPAPVQVQRQYFFTKKGNYHYYLNEEGDTVITRNYSGPATVVD